MQKFPWRLSLLISCLLILFLTLFPGNRLPRLEDLDDIKGLDLVVHFAMFALAGAMLAGLLRRIGSLAGKSGILLKVLMFGIIFGAITEFLQFILPIFRDASFIDLAADAFGAFAGSLLIQVLLKSKSMDSVREG